jgi:hypothetical protein
MPPFTDAPEGAFGGARPFASADDAWFWTMRALQAQRGGTQAPADAGRIARPCEPADVLACLARLHRARRISRDDVHFLDTWGRSGAAPDPERHPPSAVRVWRELMQVLHPELQRRGIVASGGIAAAWLCTEQLTSATMFRLSADEILAAAKGCVALTTLPRSFRVS